MVTPRSIMSICPHLIPQDKCKTQYEGFITVSGRDFHLKVELPPNKQLKNARVLCGWKLQQLLHGCKDVVCQRIQQSPDLQTFLVELKITIEKMLESESMVTTGEMPRLYTHLIQQIEDIGWDSTLQDIYHQFSQELEKYQDYFDIIDEIDGKTWVLEPENPSYASTLRRIALGSSSSLQIDIDPFHPRVLPECRFLGADHVVNPLRDKLNANLERWDPLQSALMNLHNIIQIEFPSPSKIQKQDFSMECGICYSYRLETTIPDKVCEDPRCGQPFHQTCLYEWLRALPSSRQSFNTIFGECPYCSKPITVKMVTK
ncbi:E3 ubiquitin-protein ligase FANCL-like [Saccoglossus kowalevskii]|uniref:E3 ubiquitin-protein ligase FANCL-like n=1 Tax=Saccoglossus kowalevskii TaxID=10224 RepID=A0ABM0MAL3_SACKO|nr:PREDICTED: E3 ubiquitin-protein ligase FANCL-like [Saccoglossus kowalevskii]